MTKKYKTIYLTGKTNGTKPYELRKEFDEVQTVLNNQGYICCNPRRQFTIKSWEDNMIRDLQLLVDCDALCLIGDWEKSTNSQIELLFAKRMQKEIYQYNDGELVLY